MQYTSTRGQSPDLDFAEACLTGLAPDGGLYLPKQFPSVDASTLTQWKQLSYVDLAVEILRKFAVGSDLDTPALPNLITTALQDFRHQAIAPLVQLDDQSTWLLELFHGPTLAFKDYALQVLGQLAGHLLKQEDKHITVLGATSGDTGSAAIAAFEKIPNTQVYILHPKGRMSQVQQRQMTTVLSQNVHNIAIEGSFDDCQDLVKAAFNDLEFRHEVGLTAVNSINIVRIVAQMVYYVQASLQLGGTSANPIHFCVPTGNFGNIFAAYLAKQIGVPIGQLVIASNRNDILPRTYRDGAMVLKASAPSLSPSMDIQISSNFERLLYLLVGQDSQALSNMMQDFRDKKQCALPAEAMERWRQDFLAFSVDDDLTHKTIADIYRRTGMLIDPHTAVGVSASQQAREAGLKGTLVSLACAHPAKFPGAVDQATGQHPALPEFLSDLFEREERLTVLPNDLATLKKQILADQ